MSNDDGELFQTDSMSRIGYTNYFDYWKKEIGLDPYDINDWHYGFIDLLNTIFLSPGNKVLDLGCAGGTTTLLLNNLGHYHVFGCDINAEVIQNTPHNEIKNRLYKIDTTKLSKHFVPNYFDFINSHMVFEHFPDWEYSKKVVSEVSKILKEGGLFFCVTVCGINQNLEEMIAIRNTGVNIDITHVNVRPRNMWVDEFLSNGLVDVSNIYCPLVDCFVSNVKFSYFEQHKWDMFVFAKPINIGNTSRQFYLNGLDYFVGDATIRLIKLLNFQKAANLSRPDLYKRIVTEREVNPIIRDVIYNFGIKK